MIEIFYLTNRRQHFLISHARELKHALLNLNNVQKITFLGNRGTISETTKNTIKDLLGDLVNFEDYFGHDDYILKLRRIGDSKAEHIIKIDEDCYMTSESWHQFLNLLPSLQNTDLFLTGCITNGIPTCDLFLEYHAKQIKKHIEDNFFCKVDFTPINGADYRILNHPELKNKWNSDLFWSLLSSLDHPYQGIHPIRISFDANVVLNNHLLKNFEEVMKPKKIPVIREISKYPHYCPQVLGMKPFNLLKILNSKELFYDAYEEVPLNLFREKNNMAMVIAAGIPILHIMFNWSGDFGYENQVIYQINDISQNRNREILV